MYTQCVRAYADITRVPQHYFVRYTQAMCMAVSLSLRLGRHWVVYKHMIQVADGRCQLVNCHHAITHQMDVLLCLLSAHADDCGLQRPADCLHIEYSLELVRYPARLARLDDRAHATCRFRETCGVPTLHTVSRQRSGLSVCTTVRQLVSGIARSIDRMIDTVPFGDRIRVFRTALIALLYSNIRYI